MVAALAAYSGAAVPLNSVQVTIQTTKDLPYQYTLTAYNTSGYQVANFYGNFPEAAFGVPSGTYLITASAYYQGINPCYPCPLGTGVNETAIPIRYQSPIAEYGYAVEKVTGPIQITIATKNETDYPLVSMPVHVSFFNGTAAAGASVSAYIVQMGYGSTQGWVSYGQTGNDGNFTLVMPDAPVEVSTYLSLPILLPKNVTTTVPVEVGGQKVNVTVYWQPTQVNLFGQALILPPQKGVDITLQYRQYPYPIYYSGPPTVIQGGGTTITVTSTMTGSPAQASPSSQSGRISPFAPTGAQLSSPAQAGSSPGPDPVTTVVLALGAGAAAVIAVVAGMIVGKRKRAVQSARP
jgi:hypothetical protein